MLRALGRGARATGARPRGAGTPRGRRLLASLVLAGCAPAAPAALAPGSDTTSRAARFLALDRAGDAARARGDVAAWQAALAAMDRLAPGFPPVARGAARAALAAGDTAAAVRVLARLARLGGHVALDSTTGLAALAAAPGARRLHDAFARAMRPVLHGDTAFRVPEPDALVEDIAFDPARRRFLLGSLRYGAVLAVDTAGRLVRRYAPGAGAPRWAVVGVGVDARRDLLWFTATPDAAQATPTPGAPGGTALVAIALATGEERTRLVPPADGVPHAFRDLAVGPDGTVYLADGGARCLRALAPGATRLHDVVPCGRLVSPQTPAPTPDGRALFVSDHVLGIARVALPSGRLDWLASDVTTLAGIDGLYALDARTLVAVQNGTTPSRVVRLALDRAGTRVIGSTVLAANVAVLDEPVHGVVVGASFHLVANQQAYRVQRDGAAALPRLDVPVVLRLTLR